MKAAFIHSVELIKLRIAFEHIREMAREGITSLYRKIKDATETEDVVLVVWLVLVSYLLYTGYCKFGECGKIIGLYKQLRF